MCLGVDEAGEPFPGVEKDDKGRTEWYSYKNKPLQKNRGETPAVCICVFSYALCRRNGNCEVLRVMLSPADEEGRLI